MFIDASALTAMIVGEHDAPELAARMQGRAIRNTSPLAVWEAVVAVARILNLPVGEAEAAVEDYLKLAAIVVAPVPAEARGLALDAFKRFGKGRHPAGLNFGDCFSYACAKLANMPLLYKGEDFSQTDITPA